MEHLDSLQLKSGTTPKEKLSISLPLCKSTLARDLVLEAATGVDQTALALTNDPTLPQDLSVLIQGLQGGIIDCRESGTALRFLTAYHAIHGGTHHFSGTDRLAERPIIELLDLLTESGAKITYGQKEGHLPYTITSDGALAFPKIIDAQGWQSSQYVSALLLSGVRSAIIYPKSSPSSRYVDLTIRRMEKFGYSVARDVRTIQIKNCRERRPIAKETNDSGKRALQRDWSAASYWYELLTLSPHLEQIHLDGLHTDSGHPDECVSALYAKYFAIQTNSTGDDITKVSPPSTSELKLDLAQSPDLFLTIACTCLGLKRPFHFTGLSLLPHKESNRILSFIENAEVLGATGFEHTDNEIKWDGTLSLTPSACIDPNKDHRTAMAFAILLSSGLLNGTYSMNTPEVVSKSYPTFWQELAKFTDRDPLFSPPNIED